MKLRQSAGQRSILYVGGGGGGGTGRSSRANAMCLLARSMNAFNHKNKIPQSFHSSPPVL